jgi:hypothetical protein
MPLSFDLANADVVAGRKYDIGSLLEEIHTGGDTVQVLE